MKQINNTQQEEMIEATVLLELSIDHDHITIPVIRFSELIKKEVEWSIVRNIHFSNTPSYVATDYFNLIFGPKKKEESNA